MAAFKRMKCTLVGLASLIGVGLFLLRPPISSSHINDEFLGICGKLEPVDNHTWQTVLYNQLYVLSAFRDNRIRTGQIKVIGATRTSRKMNIVRLMYDTKYCIIRYKGDTKQDIVPATEQLFWSVIIGKRLGAVYYTCDSDRNLTPLSVTLFDSAGDNLPNSILVVDPERKKRTEFTVCVPPIRGMIDHNRFVEFIEMNKLLGVEKLVFYLFPEVETLRRNRSNNHFIREYLEFYKHQGIVDLYTWNMSLELTKGIHSFGQIACINDCLSRYMYKSDYITFYDVDELIVPTGDIKTWKELVKKFKHQLGNSFDKTCAFTFNTNHFVTRDESNNVPITEKNLPHYLVENKNFSHLVVKYDIKSLRYLNRDKVTRLWNANKVMVSPTKVIAMATHEVQVCTQGTKYLIVDNDVATNQHYRIPKIPAGTRTSYTQQVHNFLYGVDNSTVMDTRILKYADQLLQNVDLFHKNFQSWKSK